MLLDLFCFFLFVVLFFVFAFYIWVCSLSNKITICNKCKEMPLFWCEHEAPDITKCVKVRRKKKKTNEQPFNMQWILETISIDCVLLYNYVTVYCAFIRLFVPHSHIVYILNHRPCKMQMSNFANIIPNAKYIWKFSKITPTKCDCPFDCSKSRVSKLNANAYNMFDQNLGSDHSQSTIITWTNWQTECYLLCHQQCFWRVIGNSMRITDVATSAYMVNGG